MLRGNIYKIIATTPDFDEADTYYGSTTKTIKKRMKYHRSDYNKWKNGKVKNKCSSCELFNKYGITNCIIVLLEEVEVENKKQLIDIESNYIRNNKCINKVVPNRTIEEQRKIYSEANIDKIKDYNKQYYLKNKDTIKTQVNQYSLKNKEKIKEYKKQYNQDNKTRLKEKHSCECGGYYTTEHKSSHFKTKLHTNFISKNNVNII